MPKTIVMCSDGTGTTFDRRTTNVTELVHCLELDAPERQVVLYDQGVGTSARRVRQAQGARRPAALTILPAPVSSSLDPGAVVGRVRGLAFGHGLRQNVGELYRALASSYDEGDRIFLFGFSRGAFTVRALAGLLHRCGLPRPQEPDLGARFDRAWELFRPMAPDQEAVDGLRREHRSAPVHFLGVWDTVKSYGGLRPVVLPHLRHNPDVAHVRHALALDERRAWFKPTTWGGLDLDRTGAMTRTAPRDAERIREQDVAEVWFVGSHADVGGGVTGSDTPAIALRWMLGEAVDVPGPLTLSAQGERVLARRDPEAEPASRGTWTATWRVVEQLPRLEIDNSGRYPVLVRHRGSDGVRHPEGSLRDGVVTLHETARSRGRSIGAPVAYRATRRRPAAV